MYKKIAVICLVFLLIVLFVFCNFKYINSAPCFSEETKYCIGGETVGIKLLATGVLVMGVDRLDDVFCVGDVILEVNGEKIDTDAKFQEYIALGKELDIKLERNGGVQSIKASPIYNDTSKSYKMGLWVKDSSAGIGTITYYEENTMRFAALGHAITETSNKFIVPITTGGITNIDITGIKVGKPKLPGELKANITNDTIGEIYFNTENGIFGMLKDSSKILENCTEVEIGEIKDIRKGKASIFATIDDTGKHEYTVEIEKIILGSTGNKNFVIHITDEELLSKTGGIVQGMSGAPIIQNGKLIGSITHVFLDDPTRGYGSFIENMVNDMEKIE